MSDDTTIVRYNCSNCGNTNIWTRNEILQRGSEIIYRGDDEVVYTLLCKHCRIERMRIAVKREEK